MNLIAPIGLFLLLMASITVYGYRRYAKPGRVYERLSPAAVSTPGLVLEHRDEQVSPFVRLVHGIGEHVPISPQDTAEAKKSLIAAGYRSDTALHVYYGAKILLAVTLFLLALLFKDSATENSVLRVVLMVAAGGGGYFLPTFLLERRIQSRQDVLRLSLPDALDLLVVSVEAGMGFDQAIQTVSRELYLAHKQLSEELMLLTLEMRAGKRRAEALRNFADRTAEPEIRKLVAILVQSDRFGTSMGESLRSHSDFMRVRRRQEAEERAAKVGVKLVFPIFFFILPSMLVVAAGPGLLRIFKYLFPLMKGFKG